ncbi:MAG: protein kinase domain-containing protein [Gemmataceae bacterium]
MTVKVETLLDQAVQAGLLPDDVRAAQSALSSGQRESIDAIVGELVRRGKLTRFQGKHILKGKMKALILGSYVVQEPIGQGGMGMVFRARHTLMGRTAAVKLLPTTMSKNPDDVRRFLREMKAAAQLEHPNIVQAYDAACANGRYFLAMECVDGKVLDKIVKERGPLPVSLAVDFVLQAARGLTYAHQRGIIHRDIKPSNLILGPRNHVQILDMGLARFIGDGQNKSINLSGTDTSMGTADFMAPEQAIELKSADARSDIYSLGCTLYFLICGDVMWASAPATTRLMSHQKTPAPSLCEGRKDVPLGLDAVFHRMVAKRPEDRYQKMAEVVAELQRCLGGKSAQDTAVVSARQTSKVVKAEIARQRKAEHRTHRFHLLVLAIVAAIPLLLGVTYEAWVLSQPKERVESMSSLPTGPGAPEKFRLFNGHTAMVESASFSRDGRLAVSSGADKMINLWDVNAGRLVRGFTGHTGNIFCAIFTNDMKHIISGSADKTVRIWEKSTGQELYCFEFDSGVNCVAVSRDGQRLIAACDDGTLHLWDLGTRRELRTLSGHEDKVWTVVMSPDGKRAVSGGHDRTVRLWDLDTGKEIRTFSGHTNDVRRVALSPDGNRILSGSWDRTMRLWNVGDGRELKSLNGGSYYVEGVSFSPEGRYALSSEGMGAQGAGSDHAVCLWDLDTGKLVHRMAGVNCKILETTFSPSGRQALFACSDNRVRLWEIPSNLK